MSVSAAMRDRVLAELARLEVERSCRILHAVESGSRAWGFASLDSDYDVRFVYVRPRDWYLSINLESRRDVIEQTAEGDLDLAGWDLRKALALFAKGNPPLLEWLDSPIVYLDRLGLADRLRGLVPTWFNPRAATYHYLQMARGNFRDYLQGERVRLKKYLYVIRPLLGARWVEQGRGAVPMAFDRLLESVAEEAPDFVAATRDLVERKRAGEELMDGPRVRPIHDFLGAEFARLETVTVTGPGSPGDLEPLHRLFREFLAKAWE